MGAQEAAIYTWDSEDSVPRKLGASSETSHLIFSHLHNRCSVSHLEMRIIYAGFVLPLLVL